MNKQLSLKQQRARREPRKRAVAKCDVCFHVIPIVEGCYTNHQRPGTGKQCKASHQPVERMIKVRPAGGASFTLLSPEQILANLRGGAGR